MVDGYASFLVQLATESFLWRLARFNAAAWEFPEAAAGHTLRTPLDQNFALFTKSTNHHQGRVAATLRSLGAGGTHRSRSRRKAFSARAYWHMLSVTGTLQCGDLSGAGRHV